MIFISDFQHNLVPEVGSLKWGFPGLEGEGGLQPWGREQIFSVDEGAWALRRGSLTTAINQAWGGIVKFWSLLKQTNISYTKSSVKSLALWTVKLLTFYEKFRFGAFIKINFLRIQVCGFYKQSGERYNWYNRLFSNQVYGVWWKGTVGLQDVRLG